MGMKATGDRTEEANDLVATITGNMFPCKIPWLKMPQGSRKVEMIQVFSGHCGTVTMTVVAAGGTGRSGFHITCNGCGMQAARFPAMPSPTLRQFTGIWKPDLNVHKYPFRVHVILRRSICCPSWISL